MKVKAAQPYEARHQPSITRPWLAHRRAIDSIGDRRQWTVRRLIDVLFEPAQSIEYRLNRIHPLSETGGIAVLQQLLLLFSVRG